MALQLQRKDCLLFDSSNQNPALGHMLVPEAMLEVKEMGYVDGATSSFLGLGIGYEFSFALTRQTEHDGRVVLKTNPGRDA